MSLNINSGAVDEYQEAIDYMRDFCIQYPEEVKRKIWELITTRGDSKLRFGEMPDIKKD